MKIHPFVDSHTHAIFAEPRLKDFELRNKGVSYQEIARQGGGILSSVEKVRKASQEILESNLAHWSQEALKFGVTTMEVKTGYGLSLKDEKKLLLAIGMAQKKTPVTLIPTLLGAHAIAPEYKDNPDRYVDLIIKEMLPKFKGLAQFVDVFCESGYFSLPQTKKILIAAKDLGYKLKIHADQITNNGGARLAVELGCVSADHLDQISDEDIKLLAQSHVVATLLPGSNFFLKTGRYPPARKLIDSGATVALATDFNPGTSPTLNMPFIISLAVLYMGMTIEEALTAATINGARALDLAVAGNSFKASDQDDCVEFEISDYREIPYYFAVNLISRVIKKGKIVYEKKA